MHVSLSSSKMNNIIFYPNGMEHKEAFIYTKDIENLISKNYLG